MLESKEVGVAASCCYVDSLVHACGKLVVDADGNTVSREVDLLDCWKVHFSELAKSKLDANSAESRVQSNHNNQVFDTPFTIEEIERAVNKLKGGGFDGLQPEHIKYGGHSLLIWLQRIFNGIILLEDIPQLEGGTHESHHPGIQGQRTRSSEPKQLSWHNLDMSHCEMPGDCHSKQADMSPIKKRVSPMVHKQHTDMTSLVLMLSTQPKKPFSNTYVRVRNQHCFFDLQKAFDSVEYTTRSSV